MGRPPGAAELRRQSEGGKEVVVCRCHGGEIEIPPLTPIGTGVEVDALGIEVKGIDPPSRLESQPLSLVLLHPVEPAREAYIIGDQGNHSRAGLIVVIAVGDPAPHFARPGTIAFRPGEVALSIVERQADARDRGAIHTAEVVLPLAVALIGET